jgi:YVTN family beta-propeller protein
MTRPLPVPLRWLPRLVLPVAALLFAGTAFAQAGAAATYHLGKSYPLGGDGGWDYLSIDTTSNRLYIGRTDRAMVVDLTSGTLVGEVPGINGAHGVAIDARDGRGFATSGRDSSVVMFDLKTLQVLSRIPASPGADGILYDSFSNRVFSFNGGGNSTTVIDPVAGTRVATIPLGARPEFAVSSGDGKVYVNLENTSEVAEIDISQLKVLRKWSIAPCEGPSGLAIDRAHHRLFSVCDDVMAISNAQTGKLVTTVAIGGGPDAARFDPATGYAFSSSGADGTVTIVHEDTPDRYHVVQTVPTMMGSRTMELNPRTHQLYLAAARYGAPAAGAPAAGGPPAGGPPAGAPPAGGPPGGGGNRRPPMVPGSFSLLVIDPK